MIYLNSGNLSRMPPEVSDAQERYRREFEENPTEGLVRVWGRLREAQGDLARFLGARPEDLFLRTNVTAVLNVFLLGAPLPAGSEILVGEWEYGAVVNVCRMRALRDGLGLRVWRVPLSAPALARLTEKALVDRFVSQLTSRTGLAVLSHVWMGTGLKLPLARIAAETRRRGILLVVDGAYGPGAFPVDFRELEDVDFYGCSLYKWMRGPKGAAFGWVAPRHQDALDPLGAGWTTFGGHGPFADFGRGHRFQERFQLSGCHDFSPFLAVSDTVAWWERQGPERVWDRMARLRECVAREMTWLPLVPGDERLRGPLLAYRLPERLQPEGPRLAERWLRERGVQVNLICLRGSWAAVLSPHVDNDEGEIREAVRRISGWS